MQSVCKAVSLAMMPNQNTDHPYWHFKKIQKPLMTKNIKKLHRFFCWAWLISLIIIAIYRIIQNFPDPYTQLNGDARWTYLPNAKSFINSPWEFLTTNPSSSHVAPLSYIWPAILGANPLIIQIANSFLYILCIVMMWRLASRLGGFIAGVVSTALLVSFPEIVRYVPQVLTEPVYMFGLFLLLTAWIEYILSERWLTFWIILAALGLTITLLSRPILQFFSLIALLINILYIFLNYSKCTKIKKTNPFINNRVIIFLIISLFIPAVTTLKNGVFFDYWGISTGAGSGLFYGVSPLKMGIEPVYSGFEYDAGITSKVADPSTEGNPLRIRADQIQTKAAISIIKSTTLQDNIIFFIFKMKAWTLYGYEELEFRKILRQFRLFEWISILFSLIFIAINQVNSKKNSLYTCLLPNDDGLAKLRFSMSFLILLILLGMIGQLLPVLYNARYSLFSLDLLLIPLCGVSAAINLRFISEILIKNKYYKKHIFLRILLIFLIIFLPMGIAESLARYTLEHPTWSIDPARPGPTRLVLGPENFGRVQMTNAQALTHNTWLLGTAPSILSVPVILDKPLNFMDGIWRFKLAVTTHDPDQHCAKTVMSLEHPSPEVGWGWYAPQPILNLKLDGKTHIYAIRGNGILRPSATGNLTLLLSCPHGTMVEWHGIQLLRSTIPEAALDLMNNGKPINPYRADDIQ